MVEIDPDIGGITLHQAAHSKREQIASIQVAGKELPGLYIAATNTTTANTIVFEAMCNCYIKEIAYYLSDTVTGDGRIRVQKKTALSAAVDVAAIQALDTSGKGTYYMTLTTTKADLTLTRGDILMIAQTTGDTSNKKMYIQIKVQEVIFTNDPEI